MNRINKVAPVGMALFGLCLPLLAPATAAPGDGRGSDGRGGDRRIWRGDTAVRYTEGQKVEIAGTITDNVYGNTNCRVRGDDGRTYTVQATSRLDLRRDQRVRVTGEWRRGVVQNAGINLIDGGNGGGWGSGGNFSNGQKVEIAATVLSDINGGRVLNVRGDNGSRYLVAASSPVTLRRDQRVKVTGVWRDNMIADAGVNFLDGDSDGRPDFIGSDKPGNGQRLEFVGYVLDRVRGSSFLRVQADNGTTYNVQATSGMNLVRNTRVKVTGTWNGNNVINAGVNIIDGNGNGRPDFDPNYGHYYDGQRLEFAGSVLEDVKNTSTFRVRGDNNVTYTVSAPRSVNLNRGQRVRVTGDWRGGVVSNAGVNLQ